MAADDRGLIFERLVRLEGVVRQQGDQVGDLGGVVDHVVNTLDTIVLPTQAGHTVQLAGQQKVIDEHAEVTKKASEFMSQASGAWLFVQRAGIVVAALASVVTLVMKLRGM